MVKAKQGQTGSINNRIRRQSRPTRQSGFRNQQICGASAIFIVAASTLILESKIGICLRLKGTTCLWPHCSIFHDAACSSKTIFLHYRNGGQLLHNLLYWHAAIDFNHSTSLHLPDTTEMRLDTGYVILSKVSLVVFSSINASSEPRT